MLFQIFHILSLWPSAPIYTHTNRFSFISKSAIKLYILINLVFIFHTVYRSLFSLVFLHLFVSILLTVTEENVSNSPCLFTIPLAQTVHRHLPSQTLPATCDFWARYSSHPPSLCPICFLGCFFYLWPSCCLACFLQLMRIVLGLATVPLSLQTSEYLVGSKDPAEENTCHYLQMLPGQLSPGSLQCPSLKLSSVCFLFQPVCIICGSSNTS